MYELKTQPDGGEVETFLAAVAPDQRQADARAVCALVQRVSGLPPVMWGPSIVGFGAYHYRYASGHEGDMCRIGFSPRKAALTLYVTGAMLERPELIARLGKVTTGKGCLYIRRLADVDADVLEELVREALAWVNRTYAA